jgi:TPR repeat protein
MTARYITDCSDYDARDAFGPCFEYGKGVHSDLSKAAEYWLVAADDRHKDAQFDFGSCLQDRLGVSIDLELSATYSKEESADGKEEYAIKEFY